MKAVWNSLTLAGLGLVTAAAMAQPPEGPPGRGPRRDSPPGGPPVIRALDTDKDGELSADEIAKAAESLKSLDKNDDGKLSEDELRPPRPEGAPGRSDAYRGPGRPEGSPEFGPPPGEGRGGPRERRRFSQDGPRGPRGPRGGDFGPPPGPGGPPPFAPPHLRERLGLSDEQVKQLDALHKEAREKFEKILTPEQLEKLKAQGPSGPPSARD